MREHHLPVRRTARYFTLGHDRSEIDELWIVCHGYGQLARSFLRRFQPIDSAGRLIVAPEGLNRFYLDPRGGAHPDAKVGATWMTREDRLSDIDDYVAYLDAVYGAVLEERDASRVRLTALGFSQGVATVSRWLAMGRARASRVILWASHIPHECVPAGEPLFHGAPIVMVAGAADPYVTPEAVAAERRRMDDAGIAYEFVSYDGGHDIDGATLHWLATRTAA